MIIFGTNKSDENSSELFSAQVEVARGPAQQKGRCFITSASFTLASLIHFISARHSPFMTKFMSGECVAGHWHLALTYLNMRWLALNYLLKFIVNLAETRLINLS